MEMTGKLRNSKLNEKGANLLLRQLFDIYNKMYFDNNISDNVDVRWSRRMTSCAGCTVCGIDICNISMSRPILEQRPFEDLLETLLHEMIHAYLWSIQHYEKEEHGPKFLEMKKRIEKMSGLEIAIYHSFLAECDSLMGHVWKCNGECGNSSSKRSVIRRSMNRPPSDKEKWFRDHAMKCGGTFIKIEEPSGAKTEFDHNVENKVQTHIIAIAKQEEITPILNKKSESTKKSKAAAKTTKPLKVMTTKIPKARTKTQPDPVGKEVVKRKSTSLKVKAVKDTQLKHTPLKVKAVKDTPLKAKTVKDIPLKAKTVKDIPLKAKTVKDIPLKGKAINVPAKDMPLTTKGLKDAPLKTETKDMSLKPKAVMNKSTDKTAENTWLHIKPKRRSTKVEVTKTTIFTSKEFQSIQTIQPVNQFVPESPVRISEKAFKGKTLFSI
ncbi:sprT-like domain-containing protein Spartan [Argonauta hians]